MKKILLLTLLAIALFTKAQVPNMLKDITPGAGSTKFAEFSLMANNDLLFSVNTQTSTATGVWASDGSTAGTKMLRPYRGYGFTDFLGKKYFGSSTTGFVLWRTNGTLGGTDSIPTPGLSFTRELRVVGNVLFFVGINPSNMHELWRSDGTIQGTYSLTAASSAINTFTVFNNLLFFSLTSTTSGNELWRSDGTIAGTYMLKDIWSGTGSSFVTNSNPIRCGYSNMLFLIANDGVNGSELWRTDGTTGGTILVKNIYPSSGNSSMSFFAQANNGVYFNADNQVNGTELWYSDGTTANTNMVKDLAPGTLSAVIAEITILGNHAYYRSSINAGFGNYIPVIIKTDGTAAGTTTLDAGAGIPSYSFTTVGAGVLSSKPRVYNNELYYVLQKSFSTSILNQYDSLYFFKTDVNLNTKTLLARFPNYTGSSLFTSTGDFEFYNIGSRLIFTFNQLNSNTISMAILNMATGQHKMYHGLGISTDGGRNYFRQFGNKLYYTNNVGDSEPGYIDLVTDSIKTLKNINTSGPSYVCAGLFPITTITWDYKIYSLNNKGYFLAHEPGFGLEFFETDFTSAGTFRVKDIYPGSSNFDNGNTGPGSCNQNFTIIETPVNIFFCANDGSNGLELWSFINAPNNPGGGIGLEDKPELGKPVVYPNPTEGIFKIESPAPVLEVIVQNMLGSVVWQQKQNGAVQVSEINLGSVSAGVYLITVKTTAGSYTQRLLKN